MVPSPALALAAASLIACADARICGTREEPMRRGDGGSFSCIRAEDCPRPSNVFVCTTTTIDERDCVSCVQTQCVRTLPILRDGGACQ